MASHLYHSVRHRHLCVAQRSGSEANILRRLGNLERLEKIASSAGTVCQFAQFRIGSIRSLRVLAMNRIAQFCFAYGCLSSVGALIWYGSALMGRAQLPDSIWVAEAFLVVHAIAMIITFYRRPSIRLWAPLLTITPRRIRVARFLLLLAMVNCLICSECSCLSESCSFCKGIVHGLDELCPPEYGVYCRTLGSASGKPVF
jgi:hypothetical protein